MKLQEVERLAFPHEIISRPTLFVSDWHMEDGDPRSDLFMDNLPAAFWLIRYAGTHEHRMVWLGDTLDFWQVDFKGIKETYGELVREIIGRDSVLVRGNHDFSLPVHTLLPVYDEFMDGEVIALHGHQADAFNRGLLARLIGQPITKLAQLLQRYTSFDPFLAEARATKKVEKDLKRYGQSPTKLRNQGLSVDLNQYEEMLVQRLRDENPPRRIGIYGHTHRPYLKRLDGRVLANTGSWVDGDRPVIQCESTEISLCYVC